MPVVLNHFGSLSLLLALALQGGSCHKQTMSENNNQRPTPQASARPRAAADDARRVPAGLWGGEHVRLEVTEAGARVEFDCAHATLDAPLTLQDGRFDVPGTFVRERGGPVRLGDVERGQPARFKGQIEGAHMTLSLTLAGDGGEQETFTLTRGAEAHLFKCK